jgi:hypothetical protein
VGQNEKFVVFIFLTVLVVIFKVHPSAGFASVDTDGKFDLTSYLRLGLFFFFLDPDPHLASVCVISLSLFCFEIRVVCVCVGTCVRVSV